MPLGVIAFAGFVVLGGPDTALGVAWPEVRRDLDRGLADLGALLLPTALAYLLASAGTGRVVARLGTGPALTAAALAGAVGAAGYAVGPSWAWLVAATVPLGACGGLLDGGLNAHVALTGSARALNLLHAAFGVGATLGPLAVAALVAGGRSWRLAYAVLVVAELAVAAAFWTTRSRWRADVQERPGARRGPRRTVALLLLLFFLYVAVEATAGQWGASFLVEERGMAPGAAGSWVASYWAGLAIGRLAAGALGPRLPLGAVVPGGLALALLGALLLTWAGGPAGGALGLPVMGVGLAAVFPTLVARTPGLVGPAAATSVIGLEVAAAALGGGVGPAALGPLLEGRGLEALVPALVLTLLAVLLLDRWLVASSSCGTGRR